MKAKIGSAIIRTTIVILTRLKESTKSGKWIWNWGRCVKTHKEVAGIGEGQSDETPNNQRRLQNGEGCHVETQLKGRGIEGEEDTDLPRREP